ncbi:hypothetical protein [Streptomyces sp. NPDC007346]|uniref:hypothetical protein n=1 Tax=Streptomyces sp. NPDC007346 TaxID=3154682 RepID=UPI003454E63B
MTQTPNSTGNTGSTPNRATPSTGAERVPPVAPPGNALGAPVPPTAAKPSDPPPAAAGPDGASVPAADGARTDSARRDGDRDNGRTTAPAGDATLQPDATGTARDSGRPLFAPEEREKFDARIHQAVAGFVENPGQAVREADATFDEVVAGLTEALADRSRLLRADRDGERSEARTEDLRIALQHYRELTERLVRL